MPVVDRQINDYLAPPPALLPETRFPDLGDQTYHGLLAEMLATAAQIRDQVRRQEELFQDLIRDKASASAEELEDLADALEAEERRQAGEYLRPMAAIAVRMKFYQEHSDAPGARAMERIAEEIIDTGSAWLELFQNARLRLVQLAAKRGAPGQMFEDGRSAADYLRRAITE
jgi:hypothetical protein